MRTHNWLFFAFAAAVLTIIGLSSRSAAQQADPVQGGNAVYGKGTAAATEPVVGTEETSAVSTEESTPAGTADVSKAQTIVMKDYEFDPQEITVSTGTTITWVNQGKKKHSATADDDSFDTDLIDPGGSKSITFDKPGTYPYYCTLHGDKGGVDMAGVITVTGPASTEVAATEAPPEPVVGKNQTITMTEFDFTPKQLTVYAGTTITWVNNGTRRHSATADDGSFDTGLIPVGLSKSITFDKPGKYPYYCMLHGDKGGEAMSGVITVVEAPAATESATPAGTEEASSAGGSTQTIVMKDKIFEPKTITIKAGTTITWVNQGTKKHSATADDDSFDTALIPIGSSKSITFDKPGTYPYYCILHGDKGGVGQSGVIIVQ